MMNITLARPYAKAAFEAAQSANALSLWSSALKQLSCITIDPKIQSILKNPQYTQQQLSDLFQSFLHQTSGNGSSDGAQPIENFIAILSEKKRLNLLPAINTLFEESVADASGYLSLTVTSAFALTDEQKKQTTDKLSQQFNSPCDIKFHVDSHLIGGLLVRSGNWVLDDTIKGKLDRLKNILV